jgi:hypothetical protein
VEYVQAAPAPVYVQSPRSIQLYAPAPVATTVYYQTPVVFLPPAKRFPTPVRDFFFGK